MEREPFYTVVDSNLLHMEIEIHEIVKFSKFRKLRSTISLKARFGFHDTQMMHTPFLIHNQIEKVAYKFVHTHLKHYCLLVGFDFPSHEKRTCAFSLPQACIKIGFSYHNYMITSHPFMFQIWLHLFHSFLSFIVQIIKFLMGMSEHLSEMPIGFRFLPTDEELVKHYLANKVLYRSLPAEFFSEIDAGELYSKHPKCLGIAYPTTQPNVFDGDY